MTVLSVAGIVALVVIGILLILAFFVSGFKEKIKKVGEKVDLLGRLRSFLVSKGGFSINAYVQRIVILVMSAASVAIIVRVIIFVVKAMKEFAEAQSWDNMDWLIDLMSDVPVLNVMVLMKQGFETELKFDFFIIVLLGSLVILGIASAVTQVLMTLVYRVIFEEANGGALPFRVLSSFSITILTITVSLFVCRLISPLLDLSHLWNGLESFFKPISSTTAWNALLQALFAILLIALVLLICLDWVRDIAIGGVGLFFWLIFQMLLSAILGADQDVTNTFVLLLGVLFPIIDYIKTFIQKEEGDAWSYVLIPLALSAVISLVATIIDKAKWLCQTITVPVACIGILVYVAYLLAKPSISVLRQAREE